MSKRGQSFSSFADAAKALQGFTKRIGKVALPRENRQTGTIPGCSTGFEDIEAALLKMAEDQNQAPQGQGSRQQTQAVPTPTPQPDDGKVKAGLLPRRPADARMPAPQSPVVDAKPSAAPPSPPKAPAAQTESSASDNRPKLPPMPNLVIPAPKKSLPVAPAASSPPVPEATTAGLNARIKALFGEAPPPIESRPKRTLPWVRGAIDECIARGAKIISASPEPAETGYIVGCDFGTSSIKLVVRQPYRAGNPTAARPVPNLLQSNRHPYLWQSVVWFSPENDQFSLVPGKGFIPLEGFKAGILAGEGGKRVRPELPVTRNEAAAAFLALQLTHCLGWYEQARPLGSDGARNFLAVNMGIPVAAQDDTRTYRDFRHIISAARALMPDAACLTHERVRSCHQGSSHDLPPGFDLVPELTAAISGYANEPFARDGAHILIDVGASTLDVVAFNLVERERVAAFAADVNLLGAAALEAARSDGFTDVLFRRACFEQYDRVFNYARHPRVAPRNFDAGLRRYPVQLIAIGGGCKTSVHNDFIKRIHPTLGDLKILHPSPPAHMTRLKCDASRLLLAYGLTSDIPEQLELRRPSEIPLINDQASSPISFVSKDDV